MNEFQFLTLLVLFAIVFIISLTALLKIRELSKKVKLMHSAINSKSIRKYLKLVELRRKKEAKRYLVFEVITDGETEGISREAIDKALRDSFIELFGSIAYSDSSLRVVEFNTSTWRGIVRFRRSYRSKVLVSLGSVKEVEGIKVSLVPLRTVGTLKKARKYVMP